MDLFRNYDQITSDENFSSALASLNLKGKSVFCYSRLFGFGRIAGLDAVKRMIEILQEKITPEGTLIIPAYTFSAYQGEVFDGETTKSTVGILGEAARNTEGFYRSNHPVYSHVAWGKNAEHICKESSSLTCFGEDSLFAKFADLPGAYVLVLGTTLSVVTGAHYFDQLANAPGRFVKKFPAKIMIDSKETDIEFDSFVKDYDFYADIMPCFAGLDTIAGILGVIQRVKFADGWIHGIAEEDFRRLYLLCLKYDQRGLLLGTKDEFETYYQKNDFHLLDGKISEELINNIKKDLTLQL